MKALKFTIILLTMLVLNACSDKDTPSVLEPCCVTGPHVSHYLWLSFQDKLGNDLIKKDLVQFGDGVIGGGLIKSELYTLEYIFPEGVDNLWSTPSHDITPPLLGLNEGWVLLIEPSFFIVRKPILTLII